MELTRLDFLGGLIVPSLPRLQSTLSFPLYKEAILHGEDGPRPIVHSQNVGSSLTKVEAFVPPLKAVLLALVVDTGCINENKGFSFQVRSLVSYHSKVLKRFSN